MRRKLLIIAGALIVVGAVTAGALYHAYPVQMATYAGLTRNYVISLVAPAGTTTTELNAAYTGAAAAAPLPPAAAPSAGATVGDWPSYNRTLTSERYSPLNQINTKNVGNLRVYALTTSASSPPLRPV
jgi:alcohol dehydrogenase (cytochrome c)